MPTVYNPRLPDPQTTTIPCIRSQCRKPSHTKPTEHHFHGSAPQVDLPPHYPTHRSPSPYRPMEYYPLETTVNEYIFIKPFSIKRALVDIILHSNDSLVGTNIFQSRFIYQTLSLLIPLHCRICRPADKTDLCYHSKRNSLSELAKRQPGKLARKGIIRQRRIITSIETKSK